MNMIHRITFSIQTTFHGLPFFYIILWSFNKSNVFACIFAVVHLIFSYEFLYEQGCTPSWLNRPLPSNHPTSILWTKRTLVFIYVSNSKIKRISWIWRVVYSSFSTSFYFSRFGGHPTHGENGFRVKTLAGKEFLILCDTEEDCETWCSTIQAAIDRSASSVDSEKPTSFPLQVSPDFVWLLVGSSDNRLASSYLIFNPISWGFVMVSGHILKSSGWCQLTEKISQNS